jgi:1,4-alpha-glucan branching enzyme
MAKNPKTLKTNGPETKPSNLNPQPAKAVSAPAAVAPQAVKAAAAAPAKAAEPRVSLQFINPSASKVCVAGSFNGWKPDATPLSRTANGQWVGDLAVKPGRHEYLFVVDGQWLPDPKAQETVPNPFGGRNSVLVVSA